MNTVTFDFDGFTKKGNKKNSSYVTSGANFNAVVTDCTDRVFAIYFF